MNGFGCFKVEYDAQNSTPLCTVQEDCTTCVYFTPNGFSDSGMCILKNRPCGYGMKCSHFEES